MREGECWRTICTNLCELCIWEWSVCFEKRQCKSVLCCVIGELELCESGCFYKKRMRSRKVLVVSGLARGW